MSGRHDVVNYDRLNILRSRFPRATLELDLVSGRINPETGLVNTDFKSDELQTLMEYNVLEILNLIAEQGHSGFSHGYLTRMLIPLLKDLPITALTGKEWEWCENQNKRCFRIFRREDGTAYNIDGRAFSRDGGATYYTSIESHKDIQFPCFIEGLETEYIVLDNDEVDGQIGIDL